MVPVLVIPVWAGWAPTGLRWLALAEQVPVGSVPVDLEGRGSGTVLLAWPVRELRPVRQVGMSAIRPEASAEARVLLGLAVDRVPVLAGSAVVRRDVGRVRVEWVRAGWAQAEPVLL
jgi:hypothetical protein